MAFRIAYSDPANENLMVLSIWTPERKAIHFINRDKFEKWVISQMAQKSPMLKILE